MLHRKLAFLTTVLVSGTILIAAIGLGVRGPGLLAVEAPERLDVGVEGLSLLVRFAEGRAASSTFRATLNGADVTPLLEVARNGAHGELHGLLDGRNRLRLRIFGTGLAGPGFGPELWFEEVRELEVWYRRPVDWDRG